MNYPAASGRGIRIKKELIARPYVTRDIPLLSLLFRLKSDKKWSVHSD